MTQHARDRFLGPSPFLHGLGRWALAGLLSCGAWHLYLVAPLPGLIGVGLAPFANMYLFFRGFNLIQRGVPHWKTRRLAQRLHLTPDWGCAEGGYLLVDERQGVWVANGVTGRLADLAELTCKVEEQAFLLELREDGDAPLATVGVGSLQRLESVAARLCHASASHGGAARVLHEKRTEPPDAS